MFGGSVATACTAQNISHRSDNEDIKTSNF